MTRAGAQAVGLESVALEDRTSVLELTRELVRIPSRGGIDPYDPVLDCMASWLDAHGLQCRRLTGPGGATVALAAARTTSRAARESKAGGSRTSTFTTHRSGTTE